MIKSVLTNLLAKGISVENELRTKFESEVRDRIDGAMTSLQSELESRGIKLSVPDLLALLEEISPPASNAALSYAFDALKPFESALGLRIARLVDHQIEVIIPCKTRNLNESQELHEAVIVGAAVEAVKTLWDRHCPVDTKIQTRIRRIEVKINDSAKQECRVRYELAESLREKVLAELRSVRHALIDAPLLVFDENEKCVAEISLQAEITGITLVA